MVILFFIALPIIALILLQLNKISIDWRSILSRTLHLDTGKFGVYCFSGKQGTGKTYSLTKYVVKHTDPNQKIYSNLTLRGIDYIPITSVKGLLALKDQQNAFIIFDEIFTLLNDTKIPKDIRDDLMEFLSQQRKQKNILLTTAQEWLNIPIEFRRFVRIHIKCRTRPLGRFGGILTEEYEDATEMKWSQIENEYVAPRISKKFSKYEKRFMESYDTYERIRKLQRDDDSAGSAAKLRPQASRDELQKIKTQYKTKKVIHIT